MLIFKKSRFVSLAAKTLFPAAPVQSSAVRGCRNAGQRVLGAVERIALFDLVEAILGAGGVICGKIKSDKLPAEFLGDRHGRSAAGEWIEHAFAAIR